MQKTHFKVVLTNPILDKEHQRLAEHVEVVVAPDAKAATLYGLVADADALIVRAKLPDDIFDYERRLKGVVRHGVGLDMIPMEEAVRKNIPVANVPGSNTSSVVEYCLNVMFHFSRDLRNLRLVPHDADWDQVRPRADDTRELSGSVLGVVGVGAIGGALANVGMALGMKVIGVSRRKESLPPGVAFVEKHELFSRADFLVLSCPLTAETVGYVDVEALGWMKRSAVLINVSRGPVVHREELIQALEERRIAGAALDVHDVQPIEAGSYPPGLENIVITPHVAGITATSMERMSSGAVDEVLRLANGQPFANRINPDNYR